MRDPTGTPDPSVTGSRRSTAQAPRSRYFALLHRSPVRDSPMFLLVPGHREGGAARFHIAASNAPGGTAAVAPSPAVQQIGLASSWTPAGRNATASGNLATAAPQA